MTNLQLTNDKLIANIARIIEQAKSQVRQTVNTAMVQSYWEIGRLLVEDEQQGEERAKYGKAILQNVSERLTAMYGKGFDVRNLHYMRSFYLAFPIRNTLCSELSWSHYRRLVQIENQSARDWYLKEAISQNWSVRALSPNFCAVLRTLIGKSK
ncbi:DUF1016 N-terminal domain-containing protein [Actinobacillus equuli subsp. haemolyticus]|uniref:DUF1016 N-terminal domain-containing protein n=1 Tax=Actinobacillus equuli TaxID=718 RepID=UPI0024425B0C|nr:DUF1016 N-terminal domain-containing protein [Actinobacillus equuli]WGE62736.1 DUF1016 N-terminal domain-containing protein [Actinobacillus equuli subsp. haemolyticus]